MERYELPDGWEWRELAQVVKIGSEQINPSRFPNDLFNYLALENIEQGSGRVIDFTPTPGKNIKSNKFKFTNKHVLYGKLRPYLRKAFAPDFEGVSATDLLPLLPDENNLDRKFLVWWLLSPQVIEYVVGKQAGVKMPRLRSNDLAQMPIPVPVLTEQQRIVAKIESLFEQSRAARTALTRVPVLMSQFRRAVLASAFRGELVEPDPNDEPATSLLERVREAREQYAKKSIESADTSDLPELPIGWVWVRFEEILSELKNGHFSKAPAFDPPGIPILRISAVRPLSVKLDEPRFFLGDFDDVSQYELRNGDLLFTRYNGSLNLVGVCGMVRGLSDVMIYPDKLIRARFFENTVSPAYLEYYFASALPRNIIEDKAKSSAGQQGISGKDLKDVPVPLPPLGEQQRIVAKIEAMFAQANIIEQAASVSLRRAEQVDQSILARAFRGELG